MVLLLGVSLAILGAAPKTVSLAALDMTSHNIEPKASAYYLERFAQKLAGPGIKITTGAEIASVLGLERQRELLGCEEGGSTCVAELAQALGVDGVLRGTAAMFGKRIEITFKILNPRDASTMGSVSVQSEDEAELMTRLDAAAVELRAQLLGPSEQAVAEVRGSSGPRWIPIATAGAGVVAVAFGAGFLVNSLGASDRLNTAQANSLPNADGLASSARTERGVGIALLSVGAAAVVTGAVVFFGQRDGVQPVVVIAPGGSWVGVAGSWP